jgi:uncharacterized protein
MRVEWDEGKAAANVRKHRVTFEEAVTALMDPLAVTFFDDTDTEEEREITIGHSVRNRILLIVHAKREGGILRIISARRATNKERKAYEEGI